MKRPVGPIYIPMDGEPPLPWDFFMLQAARGSVRVPNWVLFAIPAVVGERLGLSPGEVTGEHVEDALALLPPDPRPLLQHLTSLVLMPLPSPAESLPRIAPDAALGSFREAVSIDDLLHDATLMVQSRYGREDFVDCVDALDGERWDARSAVCAMIYLLLIRATAA